MTFVIHRLLATPTHVSFCFALSILCGFAGAIPFAQAQSEQEKIPDPDPELERSTFIVADGFEVNLFAADPQIAKPIQMNFDAQGRLWIASSEVYPHILPGQQANDKILVLEDRDGDGRSDHTTVFADGLLIPTGVVPGDGGAYVANSTELLHLRDTDGDGKADRQRVVLSGFGTEDTHQLLHTLGWGPDGSLYMNQSIYIHSHVETPYGVRHLNGGGIWRFRPETMQLEILCRGFVNPWGHEFDRWGQSFATDGAYGEGINYVFPGAVFATAPDGTRFVQGLNPGSPKHCSLEILSGRHLPDDWQGNMITNDFRAHRVCRFVVSEDGSGYASRQETELIKSTHVAFRPIDVKLGPDGAIYIADWYNPIIQHGEVDFRDPRRDHVHGRIWRVTAKGRPLVQRPNLVDASTPELLDQLKSPEQWIRLHAKLILKSRGPQQVDEPLRTWLAALDPQDVDYEHQRLEALWLRECLSEVDEPLLDALLHSADYRVRAAAVRVTSHWQDRLQENPLANFTEAVGDEHPRVRLEAVRALAEQRSPQAATAALLALDQPLDRFLDFALWQTMRDLAPYWLPAVESGELDFGGNVAHLTFALKSVDSPGVVQPLLKLVQENKIPRDRVDSLLSLVASLGGPRELGVVFNAVLADERDAAGKTQLLNSLVAASVQRKLRPEGDLNRLAALLNDDDIALRSAAASAAGTWNVTSLRPQLSAWASGDEAVPDAVRTAAIRSLAALGGPENKTVLARIAAEGKPLAARVNAIDSLAALDPSAAARLAIALLAQTPEADPRDMLASLLARNDGPAAIEAALGDSQLPPDVAKLAVRAVQASARPSQSLIERLRTAGGLATAGWKLTPELSAQLAAEVQSQGDPHRGEEIFRRAELVCLKCHAIGGAGGQVGPDLVSIGASAQVDYLIESLIAPAEKVKENYHSVLVITDEGKVVTGIPVSEAGGILVLRDAEDNLVEVPTDSIDEKREGRSLMPDGAADSLTRAELVDLVRFLSELGKVGEFAVSKSRLARRWQTLVWTQEAHNRLNRTSHDTAATDDPALVWEPIYSRVSGDLSLDSLARFVVHEGIDPTSFLRCQLDVTTPGEVRLLLNSADGLEFWLDGKPTPLREDLLVELPQGQHTLTFAVNQMLRTDPLRIELADAPGSAAQAQLISGK